MCCLKSHDVLSYVYYTHTYTYTQTYSRYVGLYLQKTVSFLRQNGDALPSYNILHTIYPKTDIYLKWIINLGASFSNLIQWNNYSNILLFIKLRKHFKTWTQQYCIESQSAIFVLTFDHCTKFKFDMFPLFLRE